MLLVYRYRIQIADWTARQTGARVQFRLNFCNNTQLHALKWNKRWPTL